ncbi:MAG: exopolysaccharide biosynthesis protein [Sphingomonadaceae bacterium]|nr:exopolysaccharide biosynthesis protein [Sphingomonadaceae bacterium]
MSSTLGDKCFAGMLFLLAAPNILPMPPGVSGATGVVLALLSAQLTLGLRRPWFPGFMLRREVSTEKFAAIGTRLEPLTRRAEALISRRLDVLTGLVARRLIGLMCLFLAVVLALPIPFGNVVPAAAIALFALGLLARDGVAVLAGVAATIGTGAVLAGLSYGAVEAIEWIGQQIGL